MRNENNHIEGDPLSINRHMYDTFRKDYVSIDQYILALEAVRTLQQFLPPDVVEIAIDPIYPDCNSNDVEDVDSD